MRRAILAAVVLCGGLASALQADSWYGPRYPCHVYYSKHHSCPYGYKTWGYGLTPHAAFGRNSYRAPDVKSFTGPGQYIYAGSMNANRPRVVTSTTVRPVPVIPTFPEVETPIDLPYPMTVPSTK